MEDDLVNYQFNLLVCVTGLTAERKAQEKAGNKGRVRS